MKRLIKKLENIFAAAAFAEAGDVETAREILKEEEYRKVAKREQGNRIPVTLVPTEKPSYLYK